MILILLDKLLLANELILEHDISFNVSALGRERVPVVDFGALIDLVLRLSELVAIVPDQIVFKLLHSLLIQE